MKNLKFRPAVSIATLVSLLVLGACLAVLARSIKNQSEAWEWVVHTREVLEQVQSILTQASEAEAAQRGFLLSGSEGYLTSYREARDAVMPQIARLQELTKDNPRQQSALRPFAALLQLRLERLEQVLRDQRAGRRIDTATLESARLLKRQILEQAARIRSEEQRLLREREQRATDERQALILATVTTSGVAVLLIFLLWILSSRDATRLLSERARLDATLRGIAEGVIATDQRSTVTLMNPVAEALTGIAETQAIGKRLDDVLRLRHRESGQPVTLSGLMSKAVDDLMLENGGQRYIVELDAASIRPPGNGSTGAVLVFRDVTERRERERALAESEAKLIEANQLLERRVEERTTRIAEANDELRAFAHTVAHDLRAPLRNVEGFASALLEDEAERMSADGKLFTERIVAAVVRMDRLITDLLAYSRLSRAEMRLEKVDLNAVMRNVLRDLEAQIGESGAQVSIAPDLPAVRANGSIMVQVLDNLVSNAIKFVAPGVTPRVDIDAISDGKSVRLTVGDNGIGIAPEHREHVFGVFERLHGHERYPGTGIGLAIVKKGIERMNGSVRIASRDGGGAAFVLAMPAAD